MKIRVVKRTAVQRFLRRFQSRREREIFNRKATDAGVKLSCKNANIRTGRDRKERSVNACRAAKACRRMRGQ